MSKNASQFSWAFRAFYALAMMATLSACAKGGDSFSILADSKSFKQTSTYIVRPVDVLWVMDNSGSMKSSQENIATNFESFIGRFQQLGHDFHMGVTSTDAYRADIYYHDPIYSRLKDGPNDRFGAPDLTLPHSGVFVMDKNTPSLSSIFITNIMIGILGHGDERPFQSLQATLDNSLNNDFRRPGAFLAIIIVSDEDDFSHLTTGINENYNSPDLYPISKYVTYLDGLTNSTPTARNYSVNTISIKDSECLSLLRINSQKISQRLMALSAATGGTQGSLCGNFGQTLDVISGEVLSLSSTFTLDREPLAESIVVTVDGAVSPQDSQNGWTYDATTNAITFHGTALPPANSDVKINFDPKNVLI
jgi:hypothetical protein